MRRRCWACYLVLLCLSLAAAAAPALPRGRVLPLARRDGVTRARGLLRNASLPLHGAIRDYVSVRWLQQSTISWMPGPLHSSGTHQISRQQSGGGAVLFAPTTLHSTELGI